MRDCSFKYKHAIRKAKRDYEAQRDDELSDNLITRDSASFWKSWRYRNKESDSLVTRVNGEVTKEGIAGAFREHFQNVYSGSESPKHESLKSDFMHDFHFYYNNHFDDSVRCTFRGQTCSISWLKLKLANPRVESFGPNTFFMVV